MKAATKKYLRIFLQAAITLLALYIVFRKIELKEVLELFAGANLFYLSLGLLAFILSQFISSFRLNNFLRSVDVNISEGSNLRLYLLGMYYNLFLPGGIGGDGYKIYLLNKKFGVKVKRLFWALILDRLSGLAALLGIAVILSLFVPYFNRFDYYSWLLVPLIILGFYFFMRLFFSDFLKIFAITQLQSFLIQAFQLLCALLILFSFGVFDNIYEYLFLFLVSSIVATIPGTIGGVGAREIAFLYGAQITSLDINQAIALSFMFYLMTVLVSLSGMYYSLRKKAITTF